MRIRKDSRLAAHAGGGLREAEGERQNRQLSQEPSMLAISPVTDATINVWQGYHTEMALKRTTVYLDENDLRDLKIAAARRGVSEAEIIREGVRHALLRNRVWDEPVNFPRVSSGDPTFASRADEILGSMSTEPGAE